VLIVERWQVAHIRSCIFGDRLPNFCGAWFSLGQNHVLASLLGWTGRILLFAEFQQRPIDAMVFSGLAERSLRTSRLYLRAGGLLMIRADHAGLA
jgi:hypothetical protein